MDDIHNLLKETIAEFMGNSPEAVLNDELGNSRYNYRNHVPTPERAQQQNAAKQL